MDIEELIDLIPAPDYPTGALIMGRSGIKKAYRTGKGSAILRARAEIEDFNNGTRILQAKQLVASMYRQSLDNNQLSFYQY